MIKIQNDKFYISAGEMCYILNTDNGMLGAMYFGKRIEPEDDVAALGLNDVGRELSLQNVTRNGKKIETELKVVSADAIENKPIYGPTLNGGKTLKITLADKRNSLRAELFYTPYTRGGISRRAVIHNDGDTPITAKVCRSFVLYGNRDEIAVSENGDIVRTPYTEKADFARGMCEFAGAISSCGNENYGDTYGFLYPYSDGRVDIINRADKTVIECNAIDAVIAPRSACRCSEILAVYSDRGIGGMTDIFHDILRESIKGHIPERRPTVLFLNDECKAVAETATAAYELGFDVIAVDCGVCSESELGKISAACKTVGINTGIRVSLYGVKNDSALCDGCKKSANGYCCDFSDEKALQTFAATIERLIEKNEIGYVLIDTDGIKTDDIIANGLYRLRGELYKRFPELEIEWGIATDETRRSRLLCYPSVSMRNIVKPLPQDGFKLRFDRATFGGLGYEFDPLTLGADMKRAVRAQILSYQDDAPVVISGDLYRPEMTDGGVCLMSVTKDKSKAYAVCEPKSNAPSRVMLTGLDVHNLYYVRELDKTFSGAALAACGIAVGGIAAVGASYTLHIVQVADYE